MSNAYEITKEDTNAGDRGGMVLVNIRDLEPRDPVELVSDLLLADVNFLIGSKGVLKSLMLAHWTACITDGKEFVPGVEPKVQGEVVILHGERNRQTTLIPRLIVAGVKNYKRDVHLVHADNLEEAAERLKALVIARPKIRMVIIDPFNAYLDGKSPSNAKARKLLKPLLALCDRYGLCVVITHHLTKRAKDFVGGAGGTGGWTEAAGAIWGCAKINKGYVLGLVVANELQSEGQCWDYVVETAMLDRRKFPRRRKPVPYVAILGKSDIDINDALDMGKDAPLTTPLRCSTAIGTMLTAAPKGLMRTEVQKRLDKEGLGDRHTVKRAQEILQGKIDYIVKGRNTLWRWVGGQSESDGIEDWGSDKDE